MDVETPQARLQLKSGKALSPTPAGESTATEQRVAVWFDADCPLCVREIALMKRLDGRQRIDFIDVRSAALCPLEPEQLLARLHARDEHGNLVSGAAAFAAMWRAIPLLRLLGLAARWRPVLSLLEVGYLGFLHVRPTLQRFVRRLGLQ